MLLMLMYCSNRHTSGRKSRLEATASKGHAFIILVHSIHYVYIVDYPVTAYINLYVLNTLLTLPYSPTYIIHVLKVKVIIIRNGNIYCILYYCMDIISIALIITLL